MTKPSIFSAYTLKHAIALIIVVLLLLITLLWDTSSEPAQPINLTHTPFSPELRPQQQPLPRIRIPKAPQSTGSLMMVQPGQNLTTLLRSQGISSRQVALLAMEAKPWLDLSKLQVGAQLEVTKLTNGHPQVRLAREYGEIIQATYKPEGWSIELDHVGTRKVTEEMQLIIDRSLYQDARDQGLPVNIINSSMMALSHFVDFQRQIQPGDRFETRYTRTVVTRDAALFDHLANPLDITYLRFTNNGRDYRLFRYQGAFYFADGRIAQSFLLKTPLNGARLSSHYGNRYHPVLGYNRQHKGTDFSAPIGTPIMAAGRGTITRASRYSSFGNAVIIEHANGYETLYAHLNGFARGLEVGDKVNQGDIIGYLGNTGLSAGRHLHYEVHRYGKAVNPLELRKPATDRLSGQELEAFKHHIQELRDSNSELLGLSEALFSDPSAGND